MLEEWKVCGGAEEGGAEEQKGSRGEWRRVDCDNFNPVTRECTLL